MIRNKPSTGLVALAAAGALLGVAACAPSSGAGGSDGSGGGDGDVTVTVWSWRTEDVAAYEAIFDVYEEANPGVTVEFEAFKNTEYNQILATGLSGSAGPDVVQLKSYGGMQAMADGEQILPIEEAVDFAEWDEATVDSMRSIENDQVYGVPFAISTLQMYYNKAIFAEHGLEEPTTWDEFVEVSTTLAEAGVVPIAVGGADAQVAVPLAAETLMSARYGGAAFQEAVQAGETDFTDPDYVAALDLLVEVQDFLPPSPTGTTDQDATVLFSSGQAAMWPSGSWQVGYLAANAPDLDLGAFQVPVGEDWAAEAPVTPGYVDGGYGVAANTDEEEAALDLVAWMSTAEFGQMFADELGQISPVPGVEIADPLLNQFAAGYAENGSPYLMLTDFRYGEPWGSDLIGQGVQNLWLDELDADGVAAEIQEGLDQWFVPAS